MVRNLNTTWQGCFGLNSIARTLKNNSGQGNAAGRVITSSSGVSDWTRYPARRSRSTTEDDAQSRTSDGVRVVVQVKFTGVVVDATFRS